MKKNILRTPENLSWLAIFIGVSICVHAGVRREVENAYVQKYENKAIFLKIPIRAKQQIVHVRRSGPELDRRAGGPLLFFKVGDQVRITDVDFRGDSVRFKIAAFDVRREGEIIFQFPQPLREAFAQQNSFDLALRASLTEGLSYSDLDLAKEEFIETEFGQFLRQLVRSSNTSTDFVSKTLASKMPEYQLLKEEVSVASSRLQKAEQTLGAETKARRQAESELNRLRQELERRRTELSQVQAQGQNASEEITKLRRETGQLRETGQDYENQINQLVKNLNLRESSTDSLGKQVQALNDSINSLRRERTASEKKLEDAKQRLSDLEKSNQKVSQDLKKTEREKQSLLEDVRSLTSNRKGLESRFLELRREKKSMETSVQMSNSLHLEKRLERRESGTFQLADLYLLSKKIGTLEIQQPEYSGQVYPVSFYADSPDTIKFTDEEREFYELLGEPLKIGTEWESSSSLMKVLLMDSEPVQSVSPRETVQWSWLFQGELTQAEQVSMSVYLVDPDGKKIPLGTQDFTLEAGQTMDRLRQAISPVSLAAGAVMGVVIFGFVFGFGRRSRSSAKTIRQGSLENVVIHKKL